MSSDDSDFDKEAEREKLREKYEQDQKDRENTQRMSELLLQGATMTGKHCSACGDPIFRYDGQEFCPTCQREVEGGQEAGQTAGQSAAAGNATEPAQRADRANGADAKDRAADESSDADQSSDADDEPRVEINDVRVADQHADRDRRTPPSQQGRSHGGRNGGTSRRRDSAPRTHDSAPHARDSEPNREPTRESADGAPGDLGEARSSLVRTLDDLARRAEATDDVSRRRELLAATREAAEALAALDRANR